MIIRENIVDVEEYRLEEILNNKEVDCKPEESIYFDLEHYVYKNLNVLVYLELVYTIRKIKN